MINSFKIFHGLYEKYKLKNPWITLTRTDMVFYKIWSKGNSNRNDNYFYDF